MTYAPQSKDNSNPQQQQQTTKATAQTFSDNRESTAVSSPLQAMMANSPQQQKLKSATQLMAKSPAQQNLNSAAQNFANKSEPMQRMEDEEPLQGKFETESEPAQLAAAPETPRPNNTGLPDNLKSGIENLSGMSMDHVRVHYNSDKPAQLQAHAYAQGNEIHVAPGQEKHLPHEAWHVVQQAQGRVKPTMQMKGNVQVNDDAGLEAEADVMGTKALTVGITQLVSNNYSVSSNRASLIMMKTIDRMSGVYSDSGPIQKNELVLQAAFAGPPLAPNNPVAGNYPTHTFTPGGITANANCGIHNRVVTAGERQNTGGSQPGTPSNMTAFQYGFSRTGGLVRDPALAQASTRLHLINHRFEDSGNTQGVSSNIMLGSKRANNPTHLHTVENPVLNALTNFATKRNTSYEAALGNAQRIADYDNGGLVTYWTNGTEPALNILPAYNRISGWLYPNGAVGRTPPPSVAPKYKKTGAGPVLSNVPDGYFVDTNNTAFLIRHLWVEYSVQAAYTGAPNYITLNIAHERAQNGGAIAPNDPGVENQIADFEANWKDNAIPVSFTCNADYYMASFIPGTPYHRVSEAPETIPSDT